MRLEEALLAHTLLSKDLLLNPTIHNKGQRHHWSPGPFRMRHCTAFYLLPVDLSASFSLSPQNGRHFYHSSQPVLPLSVSAAASKGGQNESPVQLWCRKTPSAVKGAQQCDPWDGKHVQEWHLAVNLHTLSLMFTAATTFNLSRTLSAIKSSAKMSVSFFVQW